MKITDIIAKKTITELAYKGNIGIMELEKFFELATPEQKSKFKQYRAQGNNAQAWKLVQQVTGVKLQEGGWASEKTQNTVITPGFVVKVRQVLAVFEKELNAFLASQNIPPIGIGHPVGSGTYYERDLKINPTREYGDIDVSFYIPRMPGMTNNQANQLFADQVLKFCDSHPERYDTANGKNVIVQIGQDFVQVDLVTSYFDMKDWGAVLAPEYNIKGVLCASLYSALAEAMGISIGAHGVQAKTVNGELVPFRTVKGAELHTISSNRDSWAVDIAKFFGAKKISPLLAKYPGLMGEVKVADIVNSIKGIASSLNRPEIIEDAKRIYLEKISKVANSSKFDKAQTPQAVEKAEHTKELLSSKSAQIASLFGQLPND